MSHAIFRSRPLAFAAFFALGVLLAPLQVALEAVPFEFALLDDAARFLAAPGSFITLPFHNFIPGGAFGIIAVIGCANGAIYGLIASVFAGRARRRRQDRRSF